MNTCSRRVPRGTERRVENRLDAWDVFPEEHVDSMMSSLTNAAEQDDSAAQALFAELYSELRRLAQRQLLRPGGPVSISATTLLHKAYIDIAGRSGPSFPDRSQFMGYAARVMRGLIIDHVRNRRAQKRGGLFEITALNIDPGTQTTSDRELLLISDALDELARIDASLAELVDLKFFCGFSFAEIAAMRNISQRTVQRNWEKARIYLHCAIRPDLSL
jgi:RNA polymerase sigma factor (TIGR02999 family)